MLAIRHLFCYVEISEIKWCIIYNVFIFLNKVEVKKRCQLVTNHVAGRSFSLKKTNQKFLVLEILSNFKCIDFIMLCFLF